MARKEKKYHFIYKTTNLLNGKYYIGMHSTDNLNDGYMGSGKRLRYSINKHGVENHKKEVLEFFEDRKKLAIREREIITLNEIAKEECLNLCVGGQGGFINEEGYKKGAKKMSEIISERKKTDIEFYKRWQKAVSNALKKRHKEGKIKYDTFTGKKHSQETKNKIGKLNKINQQGKKNSQFGTCWITKENINKKIKKEEIDLYLISGWSKGRKT